MQTKTYTIYKYDELTPEAQEKVRDWYTTRDDYPFLHDYMRQEAEQLLIDAGFTDLDTKNVFYSLGYCQGDGAMIEFCGTYDGKTVGVKQHGHYYHERSTTIEMITEDGNGYEEYCDTEDLENNVLVPLFKKLRDAGYSYIEAEQEPENVAENIRANEYTFLADGTRAD